MSNSSQRLQAMLKSSHHLAPTVARTALIQRLFQRTEQEAGIKGLSRLSWLALMTATVVGVDSGTSMAALYQYATASMGLEECVAVAEFMREVGLKGLAVVCLPQIMDLLAAFHDSLPPAVKLSLSTKPLRRWNAHVTDHTDDEGEKLWTAIHHPKASVIERKLADAHPDLASYVKNHVYGELLTQHRGSTVGRIMISLCAIACLRASRPFSRQLLGHVHGLKKTRENESWRLDSNAGSEEGLKWLTSDQGCIWVLTVVDELVLAITHGRAAKCATSVARL